MNRNITFRGYDTDSKVWRYGYYFRKEDRTLAALYYTEEQRAREEKENQHHLILINGFSDWCLPKPHYQCEVDGDSVGQCTEHKDINKKDIYEGDIVREEADVDEFGCQLYYYYEVRWDDELAAFVFIDINSGETFLFTDVHPDDCKVIGNVYEDPELLKV